MKSKKRFIENLTAAERDLSEKYGGFDFFAACFREDATYGIWDLVVAASWLSPETMDSYHTMGDGLRRNMTKEQLFDLDAMPLLAPDDFRIREIQEEYGEVEHGLVDVGHCQLFDMDMENVYIITSKRQEAPQGAEVVPPAAAKRLPELHYAPAGADARRGNDPGRHPDLGGAAKPILVNHKVTIEALVKFEREFSSEYGPFTFFGFLHTAYDYHTESGGDWSVTAAAPWSNCYQNPAREAYNKGIVKVLALEQWWHSPFSTLLAPDAPALAPIHDALEIEHSLVELINVELFGQEIRRAYIITCQRLAPAAGQGKD